ncbi:MAG: hypothetical protein K1X29_08945 [Bdellovibrionales bacterium]|nr:hypothetical protein [Bdellovibrionales bacterium]
MFRVKFYFQKSGFFHKSICRSSKGQIAVEYTLLLVIGVLVAFTITTAMVNRNPNAPGFLVARWYQIIQFIGNDLADD